MTNKEKYLNFMKQEQKRLERLQKEAVTESFKSLIEGKLQTLDKVYGFIKHNNLIKD